MTLVVATEALADLEEIYDFVARDNPGAAERVLDRLYAIFQHLADGELKGPEVRLTDGRRAHRWPVRPYRIYYRRTTAQTIILRVYHQARRPIERRFR